MKHAQLNRLAAKNGVKNPDYKSNHIEVYSRAQRELSCAFVDQWIPENPLSTGNNGYEEGSFSATTGAEKIVIDGMMIEEPENVIEQHFWLQAELSRKNNEAAAEAYKRYSYRNCFVWIMI